MKMSVDFGGFLVHCIALLHARMCVCMHVYKYISTLPNPAIAASLPRYKMSGKILLTDCSRNGDGVALVS